MSRLGPCTARISGDRQTDTHTDTQTKYSNPCCACAPRVNYSSGWEFKKLCKVLVNIPPSCTPYICILHISTCTCTHIHICIYTHTHIHLSTPHPHTYAQHPHTHTYTHTHTHTHILLGKEQYMIWSMCPVSTPLSTTIPVPFRHYANAARTGKIMSQYLMCLIESSEWIQKWDHIFQYNCVGMYHVLNGCTVAVFWITYSYYLCLLLVKSQCQNLTH